MQVGVRIGLDDIERLQKKTNKLSSGKSTRPSSVGGSVWGGFGFWVVSLRNRRFIGAQLVGGCIGKTDCTARKLPLGRRLGIPRLASQARVKASPVKLFLKQQASGGLIAPFPHKSNSLG